MDEKKAQLVVDEIKAAGGEAIAVGGDVGADDWRFNSSNPSCSTSLAPTASVSPAAMLSTVASFVCARGTTKCLLTVVLVFPSVYRYVLTLGFYLCGPSGTHS